MRGSREEHPPVKGGRGHGFWRLAFGIRNFVGCPRRGQPGSFNGSCRQAVLHRGNRPLSSFAAQMPPSPEGEGRKLTSNEQRDRPHPSRLQRSTSHGPNRPVLTGKCPLDIFPGVRTPKGEGDAYDHVVFYRRGADAAPALPGQHICCPYGEKRIVVPGRRDAIYGVRGPQPSPLGEVARPEGP